MISFKGGVNTDKLRMAYSNDVYVFYTNASGIILYCDVASSGFNIRLYPRPDGSFWLNLKEYISAVINTRYFEDKLDTDLQTPDPQTFIYDYNNGTYLNLNVTFTITIENETTGNETTDTATYSLDWLAGCSQIGDLSSMLKTDNHVLSPMLKTAYNKYHLKYWAGYPFDFTMYLHQNNITLLNTSNGYSVAFEAFKITRLFISDGRTSETLEDILPLMLGYNIIRIMENGVASDNDKYIIINKQPITCGIYLKWFNSKGGYSYWLFEDTAKIDRSIRSMGEIDNDFANNENSTTRTLNLGATAQDRIRLTASLIDENERAVLEDILSSPKIYMFTGEPASQNSYMNWIEVKLITNSAGIKNYKEKLTNFVLDFSAPMRDTQTL